MADGTQGALKEVGSGAISDPDSPPAGPVGGSCSRKGWTMNRYMVCVALALLLAGADSVAAQSRARVEYSDGRIGVDVAIGNRPVRVSPHSSAARGWVAADWGPVRIRVASRRPVPYQGTFSKKDLRHLLGKETVKRIEKHAKRMGIRGKTRGHFFRVERNTTVLEVTVDRIPVAELHDYRSDGLFDQLFLTGPPGNARYGAWNGSRFEHWEDRYENRYRKTRWPW
jgi:hypothetical protein